MRTWGEAISQIPFQKRVECGYIEMVCIDDDERRNTVFRSNLIKSNLHTHSFAGEDSTMSCDKVAQW